METADLPPIPIPPRLLDLLREYPDSIKEIRDRLDRYLKDPDGLQPLDHAIWALEDKLDTLISKAQSEVERAKTSGDAEALANAKAKVSVMFSAYSKNDGLRDLGSIVDYFSKYEKTF